MLKLCVCVGGGLDSNYDLDSKQKQTQSPELTFLFSLGLLDSSGSDLFTFMPGFYGFSPQERYNLQQSHYFKAHT